MTELDKEDARGLRCAGLSNAKYEEHVKRAVDLVEEGKKYGLKPAPYSPSEDTIEASRPLFNVHMGVLNRFSRELLEEEEQEHYLSIVFKDRRELDHYTPLVEQVEDSNVYRVGLSIEEPVKKDHNLIGTDEGLEMQVHNNKRAYNNKNAHNITPYPESQWNDLKRHLRENGEGPVLSWERHPSNWKYAYKMKPGSEEEEI